MGINNNITITQLSPKMQEILNQYAGNVTEKVKTLAKDTAVELTKNTKRDSPVKLGNIKDILVIRKLEKHLQVLYIHGMLRIQNID